MSPHASTPGDPARFTPVRADALEGLLALVGEYYDFDGIPFDDAAVRRGLAELLTDASLGGAWIIRREHEPVGYFVLTYGFDLELGGRQATVTELYLRPHARRQGLGSRALAFVEEHLRQVGIGAYELHVERDNAEARAFYARMGLESHDRIPLSKRLAAPRAGPRSTASRAIHGPVDHLSIGANDLAASKRFYDATLAPLGFRPRQEIPSEVEYFRADYPDQREAFAVFVGFEDVRAKREVTPSAGFHVAFRAATREAVVAFYQAALRTGGRDNGPPGLRPAYQPGYFAAFVLDPDGHHVEAVCHEQAPEVSMHGQGFDDR